MGSRRGHGEGSIYRRESDGRWVATVDLGYVDGKRRRKPLYGKSRREVAEKLKIALRDQQQGLPVATERQTVSQFLERWLADVVQPNLEPKTHSSYADTCRVHIVPTLGNLRLTKLTPQDVTRLLRSKQESGLSPRTVSYIRTVLRIALNRALKWGLVGRNVAALTDPPKIRRVEVHPLSPEQAREFLVAAEGDRLEALYRVAIALGLRIGEALGLRWEDVDLETGTIHIRRALQRVKGKLIFKEPKTEKSRRTLSVPASLVLALRGHRVRQLEERLAQGTAWEDMGLVFSNTIGRPLEPSNVLKRLKRLLRDADLPEQRFHDLRHCAASLLLAQGVPARVVMDILGHSQMATTMDLYSHVMPAAHREAAELMDRILAAEA